MTRQPITAGRILLIAVLFALLGGFAEVVLIRYILSLAIPLRISPQFPWMIPVAYLLAFGVVAAALLALARIRPGLAMLPVAVGVFAGLAVGSFLLSVEMLHVLVAPLLGAGVGVQLGRLARGRVGVGLLRAAPVLALALLLLLAAVAVGSLTAPPRAEDRAHAELAPAPPGPNVLLIILDTVRSASLGLYDAALSTSPGLVAFAGEGVVFDRAYAPSPWTLPSHATLFTGRWPHQHGADWKRPLDGRYLTLAEAMSDRGYATAAFVGNLTWASRNLGLERGFARYEDYPVSASQIILSSGLGRRIMSLDALRAGLGLRDLLNRVPAPVVTERFLRWHERQPTNRPFFAFLNYFDAHEPLLGADGSEPLAPLDHRNSLLTGEIATYVNRSGESGQRFVREYRAAYENAIADLDRELTDLFRELERRGVLDSTVVIVASDHGDHIGEHDLIGHTSSLYRPAVWVPLIVRYPGAVPAGHRVRAPVSLRSLPATVADLAGIGEEAFPGRSLARHWDDPGAMITPDTVYGHLTRGADTRLVPWAPIMRGHEMMSLTGTSYRYILNGDGTEELYFPDSDPAELRNMAEAPGADGLMDRLRAELQQVRRPGAPGR